MIDAPDVARPSQLWKQLTAEKQVMAAGAFWRDENAAVEQAEVVAAVAQRIKFRVKSVTAMPVEKKARQLISLRLLSEGVAARLLVAYHLVHQRAMMATFLDALGITHEDGLIAEEDLTAPDAERLAAAARTLVAAYPSEDVSLYLSTLFWQDPETWGGVAELPGVRTASQAPAT